MVHEPHNLTKREALENGGLLHFDNHSSPFILISAPPLPYVTFYNTYLYHGTPGEFSSLIEWRHLGSRGLTVV